MSHVLIDPRDSRLLRDLIRCTEAIQAKLSEPEQWRGFLLSDPDEGHSYQRLQCLEQLELGSGVQYSIGVHRFDVRKRQTAMHDHRYPFVVLPLPESGQPGVPLYDMPWEHRRGARVLDAGVIRVRAGDAYAIEDHRNVFHAVRSLRPHASIVMADVSAPPSRENRLKVSALSERATEELRLFTLTALRTTIPVNVDPVRYLP